MPTVKRIASADKKFSVMPELMTPNPKAKLEWVKLGELMLPTGLLVACDPLVSPKREPFPIRFPIGNYPVWLARDVFYQDAACVLLQLSGEKTPVRWEQALLPSQDPAKLKPGQRWGYPVDSGIGAFMDAETGQQLAERPAAGKAILAETLKRISPSYAHILLNEATGVNVIAFSTQGDGVFATYFGFDLANTIVSIVTDISLFDDEEDTESV